MALTQTQVSMLYVAIFNRASEGEGNKFWKNEGDLATGATAMLGATDAISYFGSSLNSDRAFIEHIYLNTLNKTSGGANGTESDAEGINFWVDLLENGGKTRGEVVAGLVEAAVNPATAGNARDQFLNRVAVSDHAAAVLDKAPADYQNVLGFDAGLPVDHTETSEIAADLIIDNLGSSTFTLTANPDTATANIFNAGRVFDPSGDDQMNSLQDDDVLTGRGDNPTLNLNYVTDNQTGDIDISPTLNGINTINISATSTGSAIGVDTLDLQDATGVNEVNITRMDAGFTVDNMTSTQEKLSVANSSEIGNAVSFLYNDAAVSGTTDTTELTLSNAQLGILSIEEIGGGTADQGYETINLISTGSANRLAGGMAAEDLQALNITGDQSLRVDGLAEGGSLTTVDASGMTGTAALNFMVNAGVMGAINEGTGADTVFALTATGNNDVIRISDQVGANDTLALGEGTADTLVMTSAVGVDFFATNATPQATGVEAVQVIRLDDDGDNTADTLVVDMGQMAGDQTLLLRNDDDDTVAANTDDVVTYDINDASATEATSITLNHSALNGNAVTDNVINLDVVDSGVTATNITIAQGANTSTDLAFNFTLTADSDGTNANTTNTVTSVTLTDNDAKSNSVHLTEVAALTGTLTLAGTGTSGDFFNLDIANNTNAVGFGFDLTGTTENTNTDTTVVATANRDTDVSAVYYGNGVAAVGDEDLVAATINAATQTSNVTLRLGDATQTVTLGSGNDNIIMDALTNATGGVAATIATAGLTGLDKITAGTGTDTLVIDGELAAGINLGASEWAGLTGVDVLRLGGNTAGNVVGNGYGITITDQLIDQTDSTSRLTIINNDGDLLTSNESAATVTMTGLNPTNAVTYEGEDSNVLQAGAVSNDATPDGIAFANANATAASTVILDDASTNSSFILNGGDNNTQATSGAAGSTTQAVITTAGTVSGNNNILQINDTTIATADDLSNMTNFSTINFVTTQATNQILTLSLTDAVVDALVDDSNTSLAVTGIETLVITTQDNASSDAILNIDGSALTAKSVLSITGSGGADTMISGGGADNFIYNGDDSGIIAVPTNTTNADIITGFTTGSDTITTAEAAGATEAVIADGSGFANFAAFVVATDVVFTAGASANDDIYVAWNAVASGNAYVAIDDNDSGSLDSGDTLIILTGVNTAAGIALADFL